jgi:hypothetical protein
VARRPWGDGEVTATTWYRPYTDADRIATGIRFALSTPGVHAFCTPGDVRLLPLALAAAADVEPLGTDERDAAIEDMTGEELIFPLRVKARRLA